MRSHGRRGGTIWAKPWQAPISLLFTAERPPCAAYACRRYGDGTLRLTVEENVIIPNVPEEKLAALQAEPIFQRFPIHGGGCWGGGEAGSSAPGQGWRACCAPGGRRVGGAALQPCAGALTRPGMRPALAGPLLRGLVSCTGAQFCSLALIETKNRALEVVRQLEAELDIPATVRIHWTGCPNSCGQVRLRRSAP